MAVKKILYVEQNLDGTVGGSHHCLLDLVRSLDSKRFRPQVAFYQDNVLVPDFRLYSRVFLLPAFVPLDFVPDRSISPRPAYYAAMALQEALNLFLYYLPSVLNRMVFLLKRRIDLVHLNNSVAKGYDWLVACRLTGRKCITHNRRSPRLNGLRRFFAERFDSVICIASFIARELESGGARNKGRFVVIKDGIDPEAFARKASRSSVEVRSALNIGSGQPVIGIVGNIKRWKGQDVVVRAVDLLKERYPDLRCLIVGEISGIRGDDYDYNRSLRSFVDERGLENMVTFLGYRDDVPDIMRSLDILIHASTSPEPFGRVIIEGMVLERPVIATNFGGPLEIIENGVSGVLVPPGDEVALAGAISSLLNDAPLRARMAKAGRKRVEEHFHLEDNVRETENLYMRLLA